MYSSWDIRHDKQSFLTFWVIFYQPEKLKFWKNEKNSWRYYHFTLAYHKWWSYDVWFLRYMECNRHNFLSFWTIFLPFYPPTNPKNQNFEKMKKTLVDIIILHICTINENHMMHVSWDMERDRHNFSHFGPLFALLPH